MMKLICSLTILTLFLLETTIASLPLRQIHRTLVSTFRRYQDDSITPGTKIYSSFSTVQKTCPVYGSSILSSGGQWENRDVLARVAFIHRYQGFVSHEARADSSGEPFVDRTKFTFNQCPISSALTIRGGGSSTNTVQNLLNSIMESPSLPTPIKQFIRMICKLLEDLTGWTILIPKSVVKKSKAGKLDSTEVMAEKVHSRKKNKKSHQSKARRAHSAGTKTISSANAHEDTASQEGSKAEANISTKSNNNSSNTDATPKATSALPKPPDAASKKFLSNNIKSSNPNYRIQRELKEFLSSPPPGLSVKISGKNVRLWIITLSMPENTIYAGETYKLRVQFPNDYPTSPPSVYFLPPTPRHEHVYTNGDICLSLLGKDWRPIMTAQSLAQAIMSILCGAQRKSLPMDNSRHAGNKPGQRQDDWVYHDDNC
ncbi:hypothetical protein ACHAW6_008504 [Cyclotella cf. meneghiniana]